MSACLKLISFLAVWLGVVHCYAQSPKDTTKIGVATGVAMDTAHNYRLQAATIAIYKQSDQGLVSYQLTNNAGQFKIQNLPVEVPLYIKVTFIGYKSLLQKFTIHSNKHNYDFKYLYMERISGNLTDVVVKSVPPVVMNGDTLEFNADAFKLDPNAVTEDLLKKLPGVIVWGDGSITVNGKEVKSLLVNGKPFFNGETKMATQNIPKNAVDKVQVYQKSLNNPNPYDSTSEINIKLKEGKDKGLFGKLAAGFGTRKIYELDGSLNFFNKRTNLSLVGAGNNSNKKVDSLNTILRSSTYKGVGASIEYQPDFSLPGNNEIVAAGLRLDHDFIEAPDQFQKNHLIASYFFKRNNRLLTQDLNSIIALPDGNSKFQQRTSYAKQFQSGHNADISYDKKVINKYYSLNATFNTRNETTNNQQDVSMKNNDGDLLSQNSTDQNNHSHARWGHFEGRYKYEPDLNASRKRMHIYSLNYTFDAGKENTDQVTTKDFTTGLTEIVMDSQHIDRKYLGQEHYSNHKLSFTLGDFSELLFNNLWKLSLKFNNDVYYHTRGIVRNVKDFNLSSNIYLTNGNLSVHRDENIYDERPGLWLSKGFFKVLSNRYTKSVSIDLHIDKQFYNIDSKSTQVFQQKRINYQRFIPTLDVTYINTEYGRFYDNFSWSLNTSYLYPTIDQLAPIVDSSNFYNLQLGNPYLQPALKKEFLFGWSHSSYRFKNTFNYHVYFNANIVDHYFSDSSFTDQIGRTAHYLINVNGRKSIGLSGGVNRAIKLQNNLFLLSLNSNINYFVNPLYVNAARSISKVVNSIGKLGLLYNYRDNLAVNLEEQYVGYHSYLNKIDNNSFSNKLWTTKFSISKNLSKRFTMGSNISLNKTTSTAASTTTFTILNADIRYRALKGNNLELKFSALDLLHQNNSVINYGSNNSITHGFMNVLENYFMLTIAYFPRKFGLRKKESNN